MKKKQWRPFEEATKFARKLGLKDGKDYKRYYESGKVPDDIPKCPWAVYSKEWKGKGWGYFLGTGFVAAKYRNFRSFEDHRIFARSLKLNSETEWQKFCKSGKKPADIYANPSRAFKNKGWKGWPDFLGNDERIATQDREFWNYEKASAFLIKLGIKDKTDFARKCKAGKIPKDIPRDPRTVYKRQGTWKGNGWGDFLGTGRIANQDKEWLPTIEAKIEARKYQKKLGIKTMEQWVEAHKAGKIPANIPRYPHDIYGNKKRKKK